MPEPIKLSFRAIVVRSEAQGSQYGIFRAVAPDPQGAIVLDLTSIMPRDRVRDVRVDDYAEILITIRDKEIVEAELSAKGEPLPRVSEDPEPEATPEAPARLKAA